VYLYLDRLSNWFGGLGVAADADQERPASARDPIKQAAE
jgi:hypothetical protein